MKVANHYEVLGVAVSAPPSVIRAAHRAQMREHHPDAGSGTDAMAKDLNEALRVLGDAKLRTAYDASLGLRGAATTAPSPAARGHGETDARANKDWFAAQDPARLAGFDVFGRNHINLSAMAWYNRGYPALHIRDEARRPTRSWRPVAWLLLVSTALLVCIPPALAGLRDNGPTPQGLLLLALLVPGAALLGGWGRARARHRGMIRHAMFLGYAGGLLVPGLADGQSARILAFGWIGLYVLTVEAFRATAGSRSRSRAAPLRTRAQSRKFARRGPANPPVAGAAMTSGGIGELLTGQLLRHLEKLPGARTIHVVAFPGNPRRHVGHAVLCGDRLALIDSYYCPGGSYFWWEDRLVRKLPGRGPEVVEYHFPHALEGYRRLFPDLAVRGWTVFHALDGTAVLTNNQAAGELPRLAGASMLLDEVGNWLADGQAHVVDRVVLSRLVHGFGRE